MHIILGQWSPARMRKKELILKLTNTGIRRKGTLSSKVDYILLSWGDMIRAQCIFGSSPSQMGACTACFSFDLAWLSYHRKKLWFSLSYFSNDLRIYRISLEWIAISFSRGSSQLKDQTQVFHTASRCFTIWATRESLTSLHFVSLITLILKDFILFDNVNEAVFLISFLECSLLILLFSHSIVANSLQPHRLQHGRLPCTSRTPGACSNSCPLSQWCHPTISDSVVPFSSCPQSFPATRSFLVSQFFTAGGQIIGVSASASVLPMDIQDLFSLGLTGLISLSKLLSRVFSCTTVQNHQFLGSQLSLWSKSHIYTWLLEKPQLWLLQSFVGKVMSLLFNMLLPAWHFSWCSLHRS